MFKHAAVVIFIIHIHGSGSTGIDTPIAFPEEDEGCAAIVDQIEKCWVYPTPVTCERTLESNYSNGDCLDELVQHAGVTCSYEELRHFDKIFQWLKVIVASDVALCNPDLWPKMTLCWQRDWFDVFEKMVNDTHNCRDVFEEVIQRAEGPCRHLVEEYVNLMAYEMQCDEWITTTKPTEPYINATKVKLKNDVPNLAHVVKFSLLHFALFFLVLFVK